MWEWEYCKIEINLIISSCGVVGGFRKWRDEDMEQMETKCKLVHNTWTYGVLFVDFPSLHAKVHLKWSILFSFLNTRDSRMCVYFENEVNLFGQYGGKSQSFDWIELQ